MYELEYSPTFNEKVVQWAGSMSQWDEIWFNFDYQLARNPSCGDTIPGTHLSALGLETDPLITVFYSLDHDRQVIRLEDIAAV